MTQRSRTSRVVLATAIAAIPLAAVPAAQAQQGTLQKRPDLGVVRAPAVAVKFAERFDKWPASQHIVGMDNGHTIYQNSKGELFYLEPATGDMQFLTAAAFARFSEPVRAASSAPLRMVKWSADKYPAQVAIVGVDAEGHVVQRNSRGEKFYLNPTNGDMVFVK